MALAMAGAAAPGKERGLAVIGAALLLLLWLAGLGSAPLFDVDEGAFAEASREMLASGDWGHTTLNGEDRFDKPILVYWLQAASLALFGTTEFAARLPSALCAWAWCLATAAFAAPRWGRGVAVAAAGMLATSLGPLLIGRAATADALLNLLLALSLFDLWRALENPAAAAPRRRAFLWVALGLLTKGPVALLLPGAALLLWAAAGWREHRPWAVLRPLLADGRAWVLGLAVALPWYAYALQRHGQDFVDGFLVRHNLDRFSAPLEGHGGGGAYHLLVLPLLMLPWTPLLLPLLRGLRASWADPALRFLLLWAGFVVVFFSLSGTKLPHYGLYAITPLLLLAARALVGAGRTMALALAACALGLWLLAAASPQLAALLAQGRADPQWTARFIAAAAQPALSLPGIALGGALIAALAAGAWLRAARHLPALLAAAAVAACGWTQFALPWWGQALQGPVRALALAARQQQLPLVQWRLHQPSAAYYRGEPAPRREPRPGEAALVREDRFDALPADERSAYRVLARDRGFALVLRGTAP
ncbi:4-amino-4-deoxy-L-arabinose transferase-like glycosyltransferase [Rubrivivax sp. A210]|uniref:ArnT family glycosyltransferase n=1 Tax=Rubrivivax sp. A210 TaxID=2772301 RepID=UPI0019184683|nr:glycosyltransferase family 39 protein [Rubrivivax sp. A210]CAD5370603.1 4-amino-4-deoxy-L-arabinose transferase-like glycosyltransferase [Rubrivivax sp. A210]